jgi:Trypsin-like peptidase domain
VRHITLQRTVLTCYAHAPRSAHPFWAVSHNSEFIRTGFLAMSAVNLRELYLQYGCCMAAVVSELDGDEGIGAAFHVGDGVFVTARHVVENRAIKEVCLTDPDLFYRSKLYPKEKNGSYTIDANSPRMCADIHGGLKITAGPFFHSDPLVDVAVFQVSGISPNAHFIPLGGHLDDWVGHGDFVLSRALVLGYPPVPFTLEPVLVAATCDLNAVVDLRAGPGQQLHFILSATPRGGFSGGVAFSEYGFALGVITQSLTQNNATAELGFFATTSIEAVYVCLQESGLLPTCQKRGWDGLWDDSAPDETSE